ncbi:MAG: hypothetical protein PUF65_06795 [Lachnospiraceae bacterium]|nr:hypothetical protein [Lachnospiraceae bacterium]
MNTILPMDIIIACFGLYLAFETFRMGRSGKISKLIVAEEEILKCKDAKAYIRGITPYMYFFSAVAFIAGIIGILCDIKVLTIGRIGNFISLGIFLLAFAVFFYGIRKIKDKFF